MDPITTKPFTIRLQPKERDLLRRYARVTRTSESAVVRQAVALFFDRISTESREVSTES